LGVGPSRQAAYLSTFAAQGLAVLFSVGRASRFEMESSRRRAGEHNDGLRPEGNTRQAPSPASPCPAPPHAPPPRRQIPLQGVKSLPFNIRMNDPVLGSTCVSVCDRQGNEQRNSRTVARGLRCQCTFDNGICCVFLGLRTAKLAKLGPAARAVCVCRREPRVQMDERRIHHGVWMVWFCHAWRDHLR
jgi:hypothetical protein